MTTQFIINHLWQSSCFVLLAALLAFVLRRNSPKIRYWVWLSASLKFLIPFALLVGLGNVVPRPVRHPLSVPASLFPNALVQIAEPFSPTAGASVPAATPLHWAPVAIGVLWALGFLAITLVRCRSWFRVQAVLLAGTPIDLPIPVPALITLGAEEPGIVGLLNPVLVLPAQLLERLNPRQLGAILTHEMCHVRRRDNFFASVHMVVETIFWFNPLVWWVGARMVEERELACDEEVLRMGCEPTDYVEGILKVCRFYTEFSLPCVSGVTGADVKKRLRAILTGSIAHELSGGKKVALATIGLAALAVPILIGVLDTPAVHAQSQTLPDWQTVAGGKMSFEVASVRASDPEKITLPNFPLGADDAYQLPDGTRPTGGRFVADFPLARYITFAYKLALTSDQLNELVSGLPKWVNTDRFTIQAKAPIDNPTKDQMRLMMQSLLAERFKLAVHFETKESPVLALSLVKPGTPGPQLRPHSEGPPCDSVASVFPPVCNLSGIIPAGGRFRAADGKTVVKASDGHMALIGARNVTMEQVAASFGSILGGRPVVDQTGLDGRFDFTVEWTPEPGDRLAVPGATADTDSPGTTLITALKEQLGLTVKSTKASLRVLVIDHAEKPTEAGAKR